MQETDTGRTPPEKLPTLRDVDCPTTTTGVLTRLILRLDGWLDLGSFQGEATIQFLKVVGEGFELRLGDE